ncbi:MAG: tyrosine-type recombinase/integrase [Bacteroidetes bacterium]|nr:MAG: tyrosine-type recombinase/integrase [Bacteroidota bacterium]
MTDIQLEQLLHTLRQYLLAFHTPKTADGYLFDLNHFLRTNPNAEQYKYQDIVRYLSSIKRNYTREDGRVSNSVNRKLASLKRYYDYLYETGVRTDHPCKGIVIKGTRAKGVNFNVLFTPEELHSLLDARENRYTHLELRNKAILSLLIYQAPASDELCRMKVAHINFDNGTVYFPAGRKTASRRLPLTPMQATLLYRYIHEERPHLLQLLQSDTLFITIRGQVETPDGVHGMIEPLKVLFPDKVLSPQEIRKSVIANWLNVYKHPLDEVQLMAGHKYPSTTVKYKRTDDDQAKEIIDRFHPLGD